LLLQAAAFGLLALSGRLQLWHIIVLYSLFGAVLAIDHPARRAFLVELVDADDLANAVGLNAVLFNVSSLVGYAAAGLLIAAVGAGVTMLINAATYLAPIVALSLIRVADVAAERHAPGQTRQPFWTALLQGIVTVWQRPTILATISLMAVVGGLAWPVFGMMPAYAEEVLHVGAVGLGLLLAAGALGSVVGTVAVARWGVHRRGATLALVSLGLPLAVVAFAFAPSLGWACLVLVLVGALLLILQSLAITLVQLNIEDRVRGRVVSLYSLLHAGADTLGNVAVGSLAVVAGLPAALALGGLAALAYAAALRWWAPAVRRLD
jgi:predicted MFS family arabinose efflux permease